MRLCRVRAELPFSCKGGMCASCKAKVIEGEVRMEKNWASGRLRAGAGVRAHLPIPSDLGSIVVNYDV